MTEESKKTGKLPCGRPIPDWREARFGSSDKRREQSSKKLDAYVSTQRLNRSESRLQCLEVVAAFENHFTASQLITAMARSYPRVGAATIYRSIQVFLQANILRETLSTDSGEKVYEVESARHHDHIICLDCDAILEFHESGIERLQEKVLRRLDFREARHRHVIYAHCEYRLRKPSPR